MNDLGLTRVHNSCDALLLKPFKWIARTVFCSPPTFYTHLHRGCVEFPSIWIHMDKLVQGNNCRPGFLPDYIIDICLSLEFLCRSSSLTTQITERQCTAMNVLLLTVPCKCNLMSRKAEKSWKLHFAAVFCYTLFSGNKYVSWEVE